MKQEQKTHVSADALIQLLKGARSIRWQLALGVVMSLVLVVCALVIPTQMGALAVSYTHLTLPTKLEV